MTETLVRPERPDLDDLLSDVEVNEPATYYGSVRDAGSSVFQPQGQWTAEELTEAADSCPTSAIDIYRDGNRLP